MRKVFLLLTVLLCILVSGCTNKTATISPTTSFPNSISNYINSEEGVKLFYENDKPTYISVTTISNINSESTSYEEGLLNIYFTTDTLNSDILQTKVFKLSFPKNTDTIQLFINGTNVSFKNIVGL